VVSQQNSSWINIEVANTGTVAVALSKFHISAKRTAAGAPTTLTVSLQQNGTFANPSVLSPSPLTATGSQTITLNGDTNWAGYEFSLSTILSSVTLGAGQTATFRIANNAGTARVHLDNIAISGSVTGSGGVIANTSPSNLTATSAVLRASLNASGTNYAVYVHWGTSDGRSNLISWASSSYLGQYADTLTNVSFGVGQLFRGQTYHYTFRASNANGDIWAAPSWRFTTPAGGLLTTNHLIPYIWIDSVATNTVTDYETEALADSDGDGFSTWEEYWSGTDPRDSNSFLKIDAIRFEGTDVVIEWRHAQVDSGIPAVTILSATNLTAGPWFSSGQKVPMNGTNAWSGTSSQRFFYKLAVVVRAILVSWMLLVLSVNGAPVLLGGFDGNQTQNTIAPATVTSSTGVRELVNAKQSAEAMALVKTRIWTDQKTDKELQWSTTMQSTTNGTWGSSAFTPAASTNNDRWVATQATSSWINVEISNTGTVAVALGKFHLSARRVNATTSPTELTISLQQNGTFADPPVLSPSPLTATGSQTITLNGNTSWAGYEFAFTTILSDVKLEAGETATFRIANNAGGARLYLDNIAISGEGLFAPSGTVISFH
jgi:hypothetical protein